MKKDYKREATRFLVKNVLQESENIRGFDFYQVPKSTVSDILPNEILEIVASEVKHAEIETENGKFDIVFDIDRNIIFAKNGSENFLYEGKGIIDMRRLLDDLYKERGNKMGFTKECFNQLGFQLL